MVSSKKKGLHFDFISDFPIFLPKSGCSLKKKKKVFTQNRFLDSEQTSAADWNCMCYFWGEAPKKRLPHSPHPISTIGYPSHIQTPLCWPKKYWNVQVAGKKRLTGKETHSKKSCRWSKGHFFCFTIKFRRAVNYNLIFSVRSFILLF